MKTLIILIAILFSAQSYAAGLGAMRALTEHEEVRSFFRGNEIRTISLQSKRIIKKMNADNRNGQRIVKRRYVLRDRFCGITALVTSTHRLKNGKVVRGTLKRTITLEGGFCAASGAGGSAPNAGEDLD